MALELSRVDRVQRSYPLAPLFPSLAGPFTAASIAFLPPRTTPTGSTVWTDTGVTGGAATPLLAGPDADSSGAVVVTGSADLWIKTTVGSETDAVKVERITLLGGGAVSPVGPLPQVLSVQGRTGAVVLTNTDVGAASPTDLSTGLATKVNTSTYTAGLAAKQDTASLGAAVAGDATARAAFGRSVPVSWALPRSVAPTSMVNPPTVTWETAAPYGATVPYSSPALALTCGTYDTIVNWPGENYPTPDVNLPDPGPTPFTVDFGVSGSGFAIKLFANGDGNAVRILVDGQIAYDQGPPAGTGQASRWVKVVFPFAAARTVRIEATNHLFGGVNYDPAGANVHPSNIRRPRAAMYGDSWVCGGGGVGGNDLTYYKLGVGLGWDMAVMGHGGSGYFSDYPGVSAPMIDPTRLGKLAEQALDFAVIQGSVNDGGPASSVGSAAASVYAYMATNSPQTKIIVVGPQPDVTLTIPAQRAANRDAIKAAALAAPNVVRFIDPLAENWITDAGLFVDSAHLTPAGHTLWTQKLMQAIARPQ